MFKVSSLTSYIMFKKQFKSFFFKQREGLQTVIKRATVSVVMKTLKITSSDLFKRERSKLKTFLLQVEMNIYFNELQFKSKADKVLYTATYLQDHTAK